MTESNDTPEWVLLDKAAAEIAEAKYIQDYWELKASGDGSALAKARQGTDYWAINAFSEQLLVAMNKAVTSGELPVFLRPTGLRYTPRANERTIWTKRPILKAWLISVGFIGNEEKSNPVEGDGKDFHRVIDQWLFDKWIGSGRPKTAVFFRKLKTSIGEKGGSIVRHWGAGSKDGGFYWEAGSLKGEMTCKTLGNKVSEWKKLSTTQI